MSSLMRSKSAESTIRNPSAYRELLEREIATTPVHKAGSLPLSCLPLFSISLLLIVTPKLPYGMFDALNIAHGFNNARQKMVFFGRFR